MIPSRLPELTVINSSYLLLASIDSLSTIHSSCSFQYLEKNRVKQSSKSSYNNYAIEMLPIDTSGAYHLSENKAVGTTIE